MSSSSTSDQAQVGWRLAQTLPPTWNLGISLKYLISSLEIKFNSVFDANFSIELSVVAIGDMQHD